MRYSPAEVLRHRDFAAYTPAEFAEARRLMADLRLAGALRPLPPAAAAVARHRGTPDLRRTVRRVAAHRRRADPPRVPRAGVRARAGSCSSATSAGRWSRTPARWCASCTPRSSGRGRVEAFALGTRLTRITRELSSRDPDAALAAAARRVVDWSGGTRLGEGLRAFNDEWGIRGMARGAIVVILSDGWDRGDPDVLAEQMARLGRVALPDRVGEPAEGVARLRAARPGNGGGPAVR